MHEHSTYLTISSKRQLSIISFLKKVCLLAFTGQAFQDHFKVTSTQLSSELPSGVITLQFTNCEGTDSSTRSNRVELPELPEV